MRNLIIIIFIITQIMFISLAKSNCGYYYYNSYHRSSYCNYYKPTRCYRPIMVYDSFTNSYYPLSSFKYRTKYYEDYSYSYSYYSYYDPYSIYGENIKISFPTEYWYYDYSTGEYKKGK